MEEDKLSLFFGFFDAAFREVAADMSSLNFKKVDNAVISEEKKYSVIIGTVGQNKGRILFEAGASTVKAITESMNGEPLNNTMDVFLYLAEFTNIFCGNAVTLINNKYKGSDLRLTPPAVFSGVNLDIETPNIGSTPIYYTSEHGPVMLDIGFEGV